MDYAVDVDKQTDDTSDWINIDLQQPETNDCTICTHTIDVLPAVDDPLDYLRCDLCSGSAHIACLGYSSVSNEPFKDLIGLLGWHCPDCRNSWKLKIRHLEDTCGTLEVEITHLKTTITTEGDSLENWQAVCANDVND